MSGHKKGTVHIHFAIVPHLAPTIRELSFRLLLIEV